MNFRSSVSSSTSTRRRTGFTLVEILVVLGIIGLILSIALPITFKARRQAARTRAVRDLEAIHMALDEFKNNHNEYPQIYYPFLTPNAPNTDTRNAFNGAQLLYAALVGIDQKGNNIVDPKSNRPIGAMINVENFQVANRLINDSNGKPYLYFPAAVPSPDITKLSLGKPTFVADNPTRVVPFPLYNHSDAPAGTLSLIDMRYILGDGYRFVIADKYHPYPLPGVVPNGFIDPIPTAPYPPERASITGPFILWSAGPDGSYGFISGYTDDVTNFEIPAVYMR